MIEIAAVPLMRIARAMTASYRRSSRDFFRTRQETVMLLGFALMPLASIPEALLSPLLVLGEPQIGIWKRILGLLAHLFLWSAWIASQQRFVPSLRDLSAMRVIMSPSMIALCAVFRYSILSWPAFFLFASLQFIHDGSGRIQIAQLALCVVVVFACFVGEWREVRGVGYVYQSSSHASGSFVLFRHALSGVASWSDPRVPCTHACSLVALILTYAVLSRFEAPSGVIATSVIGSLVAILPVRTLLDLALQRTMEECPILTVCPRYRVVENYRLLIATVVPYAMSMAAFVALHCQGGSVGSVASRAAIFVSFLFLSFALCRMVRVRRGVERGVLLAFGSVGIMAEYV